MKELEDSRHRVSCVDRNFLAYGCQCKCKRKSRAYCITLRIHVGGQHETLFILEYIYYLVNAQLSSSLSISICSMISITRAAFSSESSSLNTISGVNLILILLPNSPFTKPDALLSPFIVSACVFSSPYTLTNTFACRRSSLTSTDVTVTNPTRGSFNFRAIISAISALI